MFKMCAWLAGRALPALIVAAALSPAQAAQLFTFEYFLPAPLGGADISASGTLTTTDLDPFTNAYTVVDISGTRSIDGLPGSIFGLVQIPGANLLYANQPWLDFYGLYFIAWNPFSLTFQQVNLYHDPGAWSYTEDWIEAGYGAFQVAPAQTPQVPEPSAWLLLVPGAIALGLGRGRLSRLRASR
jgi:hypothetical protein